MTQFIIVALIYINVFIIIFLLMTLIRRMSNPVKRRFKELYNDEDDQTEMRTSDAGRRRKREEIVGKVLEDFSRVVKKDKETSSKLHDHLIQAGYNSENSVNIFLGLKIVSAVVFFGTFFFGGLQVNRPPSLIFILSIVIGIVGYRFPDIILSSRIKKRQVTIASSLSDAIDLLVITVEAGLGLNAAILKVGEDLELRCPPMAEEFSKVNRDIRTGFSREEALRSLCSRNNVEDLKIFIGALVLADRLGTSIADTLRAQADSLRTRIRQRAEEQAAKAGIKMLLPLVLCILPALITIVMGPGLIQVFRTFQ